jgi:hypothetical protein
VVVIDDFSGTVEKITEIADALAPFPPSDANFYPGVRRMIGPADEEAHAYVVQACEKAAPFIGGAFDVDDFDLHEASFSVVTTPPERLRSVQRAPHFDSTDQNLLALLHYLRVPAGTGTAFYRHRATGIERVTAENRARFVAHARSDLLKLKPNTGYIDSSDDFFEQTERVEAIPDRLVIYHGSLLHSGIIPRGMSLEAGPREGRLTANIFIRTGAKA